MIRGAKLKQNVPGHDTLHVSLLNIFAPWAISRVACLFISASGGYIFA
jgi:hypothetical protein